MVVPQRTGVSRWSGESIPPSGSGVNDNDCVRSRVWWIKGALLGMAVVLGVVACTGQPPVLTEPSSAPPTGPSDAWGQLAARAAAARDRRYTASYSLTSHNRAARTVVVTVAQDGSWLVMVPGGALGGTTDVAIADTPAGLYQCAITSTTPGVSPGCVRIGDPNATLAARNDPRVEHVFTDWLSVFTDRQAAISVAPATPPAGAQGACYSIESSSAALATPADPGIYCYGTDGTLTAAVLTVGTMVLVGAPAAPPATIALPGPVVPGAPLSTVAPPSPSPSASRPSP